jgi:hypothetical protein
MSHALLRIYRELGRDFAETVGDTAKVVLFPRKQIWVWVPKNAGGSLCRNLLATYGDTAMATVQPLKALYQINPTLREFEVVAFKRNPYTRIVSCWLNKIVAVDEDDTGILLRYPDLKGMSFPEFAAWLNTSAGKDHNADPHWRSQVTMLGGVHRLLRFEKLPTPVAELGLDPHLLTHRNSSKKMMQRAGMEHRPLMDYYDRASYEAITRRYAADLKELKYEYPGEIPQEVSPQSLAAEELRNDRGEEALTVENSN